MSTDEKNTPLADDKGDLISAESLERMIEATVKLSDGEDGQIGLTITSFDARGIEPESIVSAIPDYAAYLELCQQREIAEGGVLSEERFGKAIAYHQEAEAAWGDSEKMSAFINEQIKKSEDENLDMLKCQSHLSELLNPGSSEIGPVKFDISELLDQLES